MKQEPPFTSTGLDFTGSLHVKLGNTASENKVWICLYTCCVTSYRAVHLEVVPDLMTAAFLQSLQLVEAYLDDLYRKTFKNASKTIKVEVYSSSISNVSTFNPYNKMKYQLAISILALSGLA